MQKRFGKANKHLMELVFSISLSYFVMARYLLRNGKYIDTESPPNHLDVVKFINRDGDKIYALLSDMAEQALFDS